MDKNELFFSSAKIFNFEKQFFLKRPKIEFFVEIFLKFFVCGTTGKWCFQKGVFFVVRMKFWQGKKQLKMG